MSTQKELQLEEELISQLVQLGYERITLRKEDTLLDNLKQQIQRFNQIETPFSNEEWKQIWYYLSKEITVFKKAELLRDRCPVSFDDGTVKHLRFISEHAEDNFFQVSNQIIADHRDLDGRTSRFDVTLLINGFPLVQMEVKKRGVAISQAFKQTLDYTKAAYKAGQGLFGFIQYFVISNGVNCRYYSNGTQDIEFAFPWASQNNKAINDINEFTQTFLNPHHTIKMLTQYMVMHQTTQSLMTLRPYQIYAVENMIQHVQTSDEHAYIWHTTGSGKTLTSFKASQLLIKQPDIERVIFVVDRKDLDGQTAEEFNKFRKNSVDSTKNTANLVKQLTAKDNRLVVTTIQKLNNAISKDRYVEQMGELKDKKVIFIFDECHRSQFGTTHQNIRRFFKQAQMFGFTGTPIFDKNSYKDSGIELTTDKLFPHLLHQYVIVNAINDHNVLPFNIDYLGRFVHKDSTDVEEKIKGIDTKELFENEARIEKIVREILKVHPIKTKHRDFNAMFCVSSVAALIKYVDTFKKVQNELQQQAEQNNDIYQPLKITTIFSYAKEKANTEDESSSSGIADESVDTPEQVDDLAAAKMGKYLSEYNEQYGTSFNLTDGFYDYYGDISQRFKGYASKEYQAQSIDLLIVVNMFLTGFDAKHLNTLYVDKNLKYHGLIQAYSRTNRVLSELKPFGNIVCFRNLKQATDEALILFSDENAKSVVIVEAFDQALAQYETAVNTLLTITPTCQSVDELFGESQKASFVMAFKEVMKLNNRLGHYTEYDQDQTSLNRQTFNDYSSKYKDLARHYALSQSVDNKNQSVLDEVDFQLELLFSDRVDVDYIISLISLIVKTQNTERREQHIAQLNSILDSNVHLYDKRDLIEKFIQQQIPKMLNGQSVQDAFKSFWDVEKQQAYDIFCRDEHLKKIEFNKVATNFEFTERLPYTHEIKELPIEKPPLLKRQRYYAELQVKTSHLLNRFQLNF
ncbi:deoxyribonuclease HsdR [Acinetobacter sp. TGL-Y2]|uniref:type I restriction endonuclease subunit R n=1 Tax=Acinetobacter sp. TGL-Y2 TaxID=1407071 RepID=UPI0007A65206|nr:type I restriction endonuclease subunit R [Acinetobacter sp. TGL-Y2]AMW78100.1 deoxyribonuclease HsdR [Acinetobacter sp. TGL-Y2]